MATLEEAMQQLQELGRPIEISWFWDNGVDVNAAGEEKSFKTIADILPWLQHWYGLGRRVETDALADELQKIYDSEINVTIRIDGKGIFVALGNSFTGFDAEGFVPTSAGLVLWLQKAIHEEYPESKYDVERQGGAFTPKFVEIP